MPWFDQAYYITQKVAQMNATNYKGQSNWTAESAQAELDSFSGLTWEQNFDACNTFDYASGINAAAINVSATPLFKVDEYAQAVANYFNGESYNGRADWTASDVVTYLCDTMHSSLWAHYTAVGAKAGLNPSNAFSTQAWLEAQLADGTQTADDVWDALAAANPPLNPVMQYLNNGGTVEEAPAVAAEDQVVVSDGFNPWYVAPTEDPSGPDQPVYDNTIYLTPELDVVSGTAGNDHIIGTEFDGVNTLQTGDRIDGGAGQDLLTADVTAGGTYGQILNAVRPQVANVETIKFTSQQSTNDYLDSHQAIAEIRADRISGAEQIWNTDSRATLTVNDVRINSNQMTVGWQDADNADVAGNNMDYVFRFNNQYLKADDATTQGTVVIHIIDTEGAQHGLPLEDNNYVGFRFTMDGDREVYLDLAKAAQDGGADCAITGPEATYETLKNAFNLALQNANVSGVEATINGTFPSWDGNNGAQVQGDVIQLHSPSAALSVPAKAWVTEGDAPATNSVNATATGETATDCPLLETKIDLDNVGMVEWNDVNTCIPNNQQFGDWAGDMVVGGMGDGKYVGLQRFDVTVDRGSWMSSLQSTNDALRMITVKNGDLNSDGKIGTSTADQGNLFVGQGTRLTNEAVAGGNLMFEGRDGMLADAGYINGGSRAVASDATVGATVASGVVDVMNFDASAMTGKANISAAITSKASEKYLGDTDQVDGLGNKFAPGTNFNYAFGSNDDTLNMTINGAVAADNDAQFTISMGDGNDSVHVNFDPNNSIPNNWAHNQWAQNNLTIDAGAGDDIVNTWGTGRFVVNAGAGNDVVYADNSGLGADGAHGVGAVWVLNSANADVASRAIGVENGEIVPLQNNILSPQNPPSFFNNAVPLGATATLNVSVTFKGVTGTANIPLTVVPGANGGNGSFSVAGSDMNQYIIDAVNDGDSWLSSLLSAKEGAGNSLLIMSKVDGVYAADDLDIGVSYTITQGGASTSTVIQTITDWYNPSASNVYSGLAYWDGTTEATGFQSEASSDNTINLGSGNDLAVLGTGATSNDVVVVNNEDNGHNTVLNFTFGGEGRDFLNVSQVMPGVNGVSQGSVTNSTAKIIASLHSGTTSGGTVIPAGDVLFLRNAQDGQNQVITSPEGLQTIMPDGVHDNVTLVMLYNSDATTPSFTMYRVEYGAAGSAPQVTSLGQIDFHDFVTSTGSLSNDLATFIAQVNPAAFGSGQLDNAPTNVPPVESDVQLVNGLVVGDVPADGATLEAAGAKVINANSDAFNIDPEGTLTIENVANNAEVTLGDTGAGITLEAAGGIKLTMTYGGATVGSETATIDATGVEAGATYDLAALLIGDKVTINLNATNDSVDTVKIATPTVPAAGGVVDGIAMVSISGFDITDSDVIDSGFKAASITAGDEAVLANILRGAGIDASDADISIDAGGKGFTVGKN